MKLEKKLTKIKKNKKLKIEEQYDKDYKLVKRKNQKKQKKVKEENYIKNEVKKNWKQKFFL